MDYTTMYRPPSLLAMMLEQAARPDQRTSLTFKEDGTVDYKEKPFAEPKGEKSTSDFGDKIPKEDTISQSALARYLEPYAGPPAASLRGLMPEQVMAVINAQRAAEEARGRTIGQLMEWPMQQAQLEELRARIAAAQAPPPPTELERARTAQAVTAAELAKRRTEILEPPAPPLTFKERMEIKRTAAEIPRGTYWRNPATEDIVYVEKGDNPPKGYTDMVPAERAPSELALGKEARITAQQVAGMGDKIEGDPTFEGNLGLIPFFNEYTKGDVGYIWNAGKERRFWFDEKGTTTRVELPAPYTMEDVREDARVRKEAGEAVSVDQVLREIYDTMEAAK